MQDTPTTFHFYQLANPLPDLLIYSAMCIAAARFALDLLLPLPLADLWFIKLLCLFWLLGWLMFIASRLARLHWYRENAEYLRFERDAVHFHVYPHSGSLNYSNIREWEAWWVPAGRRTMKNIGIILYTTQGELRRLRTTRGGIFATPFSAILRCISSR